MNKPNRNPWYTKRIAPDSDEAAIRKAMIHNSMDIILFNRFFTKTGSIEEWLSLNCPLERKIFLIRAGVPVTRVSSYGKFSSQDLEDYTERILLVEVLLAQTNITLQEIISLLLPDFAVLNNKEDMLWLKQVQDIPTEWMLPFII